MKKRKVFLKDIIAQSPEKEYGQLYARTLTGNAGTGPQCRNEW